MPKMLAVRMEKTIFKKSEAYMTDCGKIATVEF